jgi:hypothetical protein
VLRFMAILRPENLAKPGIFRHRATSLSDVSLLSRTAA